jgi:hypothetical protein
VARARIIDVAAAIDGAYASVAPRGSSSGQVIDDLEEALEDELLHNERLTEGLTE